jgi:membrane peptidoglycan carboxypeptidase
MRLSLHPGRKLVVSLVGAVVVACASTAAAAWVVSPAGSMLQTRVQLRLRGTGGKVVAASAIAPILRDAVVATEDERFYRHHGIDIIGVLRALPYDLTHLSFAEGASTITEQVAKLLYLHGNDHTPWRKLEDASVALKLEGHYTKEQILAAYLDSAYFGEGAYGASAASEHYFGIPPGKLDTAQATLLAGLIQAPSLYDPLQDPGLARARQIEVLRSLVRNGFLTEEDATAALSRPLRLRAGANLPPIRGVDLQSGPAFIWWQLALGATMTLLGSVALLTSRLPRFRIAHGLLALRIASLVLVLIGIGAAIRAFRTA